MEKEQLISRSYAELLRDLHIKKHNFGDRVDLPYGLGRMIKSHHIESILDYGCGKGYLVKNLQKQYPDMNISGFDPAVPEFETLSDESYDLIICTDVLEHIEEDKIDNVLSYIFGTARLAYLTIACYPSKKVLSDGRNAHILVRDKQWWLDTLAEWDNWEIEKQDINKSMNKKRPGIYGEELELWMSGGHGS